MKKKPKPKWTSKDPAQVPDTLTSRLRDAKDKHTDTRKRAPDGHYSASDSTEEKREKFNDRVSRRDSWMSADLLWWK